MAVAKCFARIISLFRSGWAIWGSMQNWILAKDASQEKIKIDCFFDVVFLWRNVLKCRKECTYFNACSTCRTCFDIIYCYILLVEPRSGNLHFDNNWDKLMLYLSTVGISLPFGEIKACIYKYIYIYIYIYTNTHLQVFFFS